MKYLFLLFILFFFNCVSAQTNIDSLLAALPEKKDTLRLIAIDDIVRQIRSTDKALAQRLINEEYELAADIKIDRFTAGVHNSNAIFKYFQSELDSAIFYFEKALFLYQKSGTTNREPFVLNNLGILYETKGDFHKAMEYHLASLKLKEASGDIRGVGNSKTNIANIWVELGDYEKAKQLYLAAYKNFEEVELIDDQNDITYSLAAVASNQDSFFLSLQYYRRAISHYKVIEDGYSVMNCLSNMGQSFVSINELDSALVYYYEALEMAKQIEDLEEEASLNRHIGEVYSRQGLHRQAIPLSKKAVFMYESLGYKDQLTDSYNFLYIAQEKAGNYEEAYYNVLNYMELRDSIASTQMQTDLVELETKYQTEKKEKELIISKAENDRKASRITILSLGLGALVLLLIAGYYAMRQRVRRNKAEKEKVALELKEVERELDFKRQELTTKVLQLAGKNEFLLKLEEEISALKSSVDTTVSKTSGKISRMIQSDSLDEEEWEQFSKEFAGVHVGFVDRLTAQFGNFSPSEIRLASLLRMNLSSKDIANILRISDEGIKKARYRLRKKLNLQKGDDLQGIIIGM